MKKLSSREGCCYQAAPGANISLLLLAIERGATVATLIDRFF